MPDWIDITQVLYDGMTGWPGDPPLRLRRVLETEEHVVVTEMAMSVHVGTHIDAPSHCLDGGQDVSQIALVQLCGPALVVDPSGDGDITIDHLQSAPIQRGDRVLLRMVGRSPGGEPTTRQVARGGSGDARGPAGSGADGFSAPGEADRPRALTDAAARWLVEQGISLLGIDGASPDRPESDDLTVHRILLGADVPILENLNLDSVAAGRYELIVLPLPLVGAEAAPARVILREWAS